MIFSYEICEYYAKDEWGWSLVFYCGYVIKSEGEFDYEILDFYCSEFEEKLYLPEANLLRFFYLFFEVTFFDIYVCEELLDSVTT